MDSLVFLGEEDEPETVVGEVVSRPADRLAIINELEDELLEESAIVLNAGVHFADIDPEDIDTIPEAWIAKHGPEEAARQHRIAKYALAKSGDVPYGMKLAKDVYTGIRRARATENTGPKVLNVSVASIVMPARVYPELEE